MSHSIAILNAMTQLLWNVTFMKGKVLVMMIIVMAFSYANNTTTSWDNWIQLDENYLLQWNVRDDEIIVEMNARAHGYVGFGLSRDGTIYGSDVFISWIDDDGHMFYYVSSFIFMIEFYYVIFYRCGQFQAEPHHRQIPKAVQFKVSLKILSKFCRTIDLNPRNTG